MLVYGDQEERAEPRSFARNINRRIEVAERTPAGLDRHAKLVGALVDAGRLLQGISDSAFDEIRRDDRIHTADALTRQLVELGRAVCRSWDSAFRDSAQLPRLVPGDGWPCEVTLRLPEGFAFYAVYPEAYVEAARRLKLAARPRVIGIRSIGASLAAVVAAALGAPPPITVRPFGDPSARKVAITPALERELLGGSAHYVIVDEGPGQSGSSFGAVADWLTHRGITLDRIALLPSHGGGPGPRATDEHRHLWRNVQKEPADFADEWPELIARWSVEVIGGLDALPEDVSAGGWRELRYTRERDWPAAVPAWERRKYLLRKGGQSFLARFAGVGRIGEEKLDIARALRSEDFIPEPIGLAHGFLIERWCGGAASLRPEDTPVPEIGHYIGTRAKLLPAMRGSGASVEELLKMASRNISLELGDNCARALEYWERRAHALERRVVRVRTDNKLDRHEWLRSFSGALIKTDAIDHHRAHDLIGCQDVAWDVAGAIIEFDLDQNCSAELIEAVERSNGREVDRTLLDLYGIAYLAFRLGQCRVGASMTDDREEQARLTVGGDRYAAQLQLLLEGTPLRNRHESGVDYRTERTASGTNALHLG